MRVQTKDLTNETTVAGTPMPLVLINTIKVRDKYDGANDQNTAGEMLAALNDLINCPRQTIRFFHRRNSCNCLQELYYKLKETTEKTSYCFYCDKIVEIRQLSRCEHCNVAQYCSYDCALAHWPEHKVGCELSGFYKPKKPTKTNPPGKSGGALIQQILIFGVGLLAAATPWLLFFWYKSVNSPAEQFEEAMVENDAVYAAAAEFS